MNAFYGRFNSYGAGDSGMTTQEHEAGRLTAAPVRTKTVLGPIGSQGSRQALGPRPSNAPRPSRAQMTQTAAPRETNEEMQARRALEVQAQIASMPDAALVQAIAMNRANPGPRSPENIAMLEAELAKRRQPQQLMMAAGVVLLAVYLWSR